MLTPRTFETVSALHDRVREVVSPGLTAIEDAVATVKTPLYQKIPKTVGLGLVSLFLFFLIDTPLGGWYVALLFLGAVVWFGFELYGLITLYEEYTAILDQQVYRLIFEVFAIEATQGKGDVQSLRSELDMSELITETVHDYNVDDRIHTTYQDRPLIISELNATRTEGSGKNRHTVTVFKGVFVVHELPTEFSGETYVSTEGDKYGFAHRGFWGSVTGRGDVAETELEWNEFEKDLHVATSDPTEARYILTPDFMHELYEWWSKNKRNIRLSFKGRYCYILFPDTKVSFAAAPLRLDRERLYRYGVTIAEPLWHVFNLLYDVRTRFR